MKSQCCPALSANTNISLVLCLLLEFFNWPRDLRTINKHQMQLTAKWNMKGKLLLQPHYSNSALSRQNPRWNVNASLPSSFHLFHQLGGLCGPIHDSFHSLSILQKASFSRRRVGKKLRLVSFVTRNPNIVLSPLPLTTPLAQKPLLNTGSRAEIFLTWNMGNKPTHLWEIFS